VIERDLLAALARVEQSHRRAFELAGVGQEGTGVARDASTPSREGENIASKRGRTEHRPRGSKEAEPRQKALFDLPTAKESQATSGEDKRTGTENGAARAE
jgi:hypothetical protein